MRVTIQIINMKDGREYPMDIPMTFENVDELEEWADKYYDGWSSILMTALPKEAK